MQLKIQNLSKKYNNGVEALKNISLTIDEGLFGLLGQNGAGKSTLMRTLATLQEPDNGSVHLGEIDILQEKAQLRQSLGYLPQAFGLYPNVTAYSLLDHIAKLKGYSDKHQRLETVENLLNKVNLFSVRKQNLGGYSGGMKQRFGIAQALLGDPRLVIVDEPTAGLDPSERNRFYNLLSEIGSNTIILLSTHIVEDVNSLCERMAIIHQGRILLCDTPENAIERYRGNIWVKAVESHEVPAYYENHNVISSYFTRGKKYLRVYADSQPDDGFEQHEVMLEDVYFATLATAP
jgi:ABC-type multidrug transport system ATPase subunit